ncbi:hypothetical protein CALVIDRAFT_569455 [Calocera viscosa TUFC12733]|uniref:Amino acid transporter transmembrane domain-containing protein n=1 Tax=Calocera viscosa (strain TUFC12733) TaxID=1330018 RepID=A0A167FYT0_CALVF|nr:hypothetical protein CALVIDRAFT_569455 [Calocera viscosa TUFC12733]
MATSPQDGSKPSSYSEVAEVTHLSHRKAPIEELLYYANLQLESYKGDGHQRPDKVFNRVFALGDEKDKNQAAEVNVVPLSPEDGISGRERERLIAHRALRTASWAAMFYLITTDVLGPFNAPYAFSTVGYVGGVILYALFGVAALYTSLLLLNMYLRLDSDRYPVRNYADMAGIVCGPTARRAVSIMQTIQLIVIVRAAYLMRLARSQLIPSFIGQVATIILGNGQALFQITQSNLCFIVCVVIFAVLGMVLGQIQSLKSVAWIGGASVYMNITVICLTIGFFANSPPNYAAANATYGYPIDPPAAISHVAIVDGTLANKVNGAMNMVYAWGGMMIFPEMMAEMRRPMDFWKAITLAELVIMLIYVTFGIVGYSLQGQYVLPLAYQGVSKYAWQSIGNGIMMIAVTVAGTLLSNIGVKVIFMVVVYWAIGFVISSAIPQVQTLQALIGAAFLMQFSYTFPPLMQFAFDVNVDATKAEPLQGGRRYGTIRDLDRGSWWDNGTWIGDETSSGR